MSRARELTRGQSRGGSARRGSRWRGPPLDDPPRLDADRFAHQGTTDEINRSATLD
jgi:hypothetical protein